MEVKPSPRQKNWGLLAINTKRSNGVARSQAPLPELRAYSLPPLTFASSPHRTDSLCHGGKSAASLILLPVKSESDSNSYEGIIVSGVGSFLMKKIKIEAFPIGIVLIPGRDEIWSDVIPHRKT